MSDVSPRRTIPSPFGATCWLSNRRRRYIRCCNECTAGQTPAGLRERTSPVCSSPSSGSSCKLNRLSAVTTLLCPRDAALADTHPHRAVPPHVPLALDSEVFACRNDHHAKHSLENWKHLPGNDRQFRISRRHSRTCGFPSPRITRPVGLNWQPPAGRGDLPELATPAGGRFVTRSICSRASAFASLSCSFAAPPHRARKRTARVRNRCTCNPGVVSVMWRRVTTPKSRMTHDRESRV